MMFKNYKKVTIMTVVSLHFTPIGRLFCYLEIGEISKQIKNE